MTASSNPDPISVLSDLTAFSKYARYIPEERRRETYEEIVTRNMNMHIGKFPYLEDTIRKTYKDYVFTKKVLPSMRSLQFGGEAILRQPQRIFNCSFLHAKSIEDFSETMYLLLSGCGVGYSVQWRHVRQLHPVVAIDSGYEHHVEDSIEGWADAVLALMSAYLNDGTKPYFDYSLIRPEGTPLKTSGGKAPGSEPLRHALRNIDNLLSEKAVGYRLHPIDCHDILCFIADAVRAGGIRRSAMIALFSPNDKEMLNCKSGNWWEENPQRGRANNSVVLKRDEVTEEQFFDLWKVVKESGSGEPGFLFSNNLEYGTNPCAEVGLRPYSFCNLTEINASDIESQSDLNGRAWAAGFIGTLQASYTDFPYLRPKWKRVTDEDALIGVGATGVASGNFTRFDLEQAAGVVKESNNVTARIIGINPAARQTTLKPSGCRPEYELLTTEQGIYTLSELYENHPLGEAWGQSVDGLTVNNDGDTNRVIKTFVNGEAEVYRIELPFHISVDSTANHRWAVLGRYERGAKTPYKMYGQPLWLRTDEIRADDLLDIKVGLYENTNEAPLLPVVSQAVMLRRGAAHAVPASTPEQMSPELAWLLGYLWGDGALSPTKYRFRFVDENLPNIQRVQAIFDHLFGLKTEYKRCTDRNAYTLEVGSKYLWYWFQRNDFGKYHGEQLDFIPLKVRKSSKASIISFFAGLIDSDGWAGTNGNGCLGWVYTTSDGGFAKHVQDVGLAVGLVMGRSLNKKTHGHLGGDMYLMTCGTGTAHESLNLLKNQSFKLSRAETKNPDGVWYCVNPAIRVTLNKVRSVNLLGTLPTYDVEVENSSWFRAGAIKSHNTSSLLLGTSSGIHAWHNNYYLRRMRFGKEEAVYKYLQEIAPEFCEDDLFSPDMGMVAVPVKAPDGAVTRGESAIDFLERVRDVNLRWVRAGHVTGDNTNNVSATVSVREDEWDKVGNWMWEHRTDYSGISVLPASDHTYQQAPFEDLTYEQYLSTVERFPTIDLTQVKEGEDKTDLQGEVSCAGGACDLVYG